MLESRMLNRKEIRAIKKTKQVDLHKLMIDVMSGLTAGSDVTTQDLMAKMDEDVLDAILDHTFPANEAEIDRMSYMERMQLAVEILAKTFGEETEKKS